MPKHEVPQGFMLIFQPCWCTEYPSIKWLSDNEFSPFSLDQPMDSPHLALVLDHACSGTPVSSVDWAEKGAPRQNEAEERAYRAYRSRFLQLYVIFNAKNSRPSYGTFFLLAIWCHDYLKMWYPWYPKSPLFPLSDGNRLPLISEKPILPNRHVTDLHFMVV